MNKINTILFDFGGVIIDIDFNLTIDAFRKLGAADFDARYGKLAQSGVFDELDKGTISPEDFFSALAEWLPKGTPQSSIKDAWNKIIIGIPANRILLLKEIRKNYQCLLLSNTNSIHYDLYVPDLKRRYGLQGLEDLFERVFLSFRLGMRKPDREIFDYVFKTANIKKEETLFIDDSLHIIEAARTYGIPSFWLKDGMEISDIFEKGLLKEGIFLQDA